MNKVFMVLCIAMSLICMFSCAMILAMKTQGLAVWILGMQVSPSLVGGMMMLFAVLFLLLAARVALKTKKK